MRPQTVLKLAIACGALLLLWSFGVHQHFMAADEAQARLACRSLCALGAAQEGRGVATETAGELALSFSGSARCGALSDESPALVACRDRLLQASISVASYHCLAEADSLSEAGACGAFD